MSGLSFAPDDEAMRRLLTEARNIAVVGISDKPTRDSHSVSRYLVDQGYEVLPVNPRLDEVLGRKSYPDLEAVAHDGHRIDLVDVFRRPDQVAPVVEDAIRAKAAAIWFQLDVINEEAAQRAQDAGLTVVMDRCTKIEHRRLGIGRIGR